MITNNLPAINARQKLLLWCASYLATKRAKATRSTFVITVARGIKRVRRVF